VTLALREALREIIWRAFATPNPGLSKEYIESTNRAGCAAKARRSTGGRRGDGWHEEGVSLMSYGHLGAQGDFVDRAGDAVPMVPRDAQHPQIADRHEDGRQSEAQDGVDGAVERRGGSPGVVPEIRRAAPQTRTVPGRY